MSGNLNLDYLYLFLLAIVTSTLSALVGLGGGLLLIPFLVLIFDLPMKYVAGTMLFGMVPYTLVATLRNLKQGYVNFRIGLIMEIGSILGVFAGAHFTAFLPELLLRIILIIIVLYLMLTLQIPSNSPHNYVAICFQKINVIPPFFYLKKLNNSRLSVPALVMVGIVAGGFSGLLGIGGGFLKTPVLIVGVMLPAKTAVGTALFMIMITASFGAANHAYLGHIQYHLGWTIALGMIIGAYLGTAIFKRMPDLRIRKFIFIAMFVAAILIFFK